MASNYYPDSKLLFGYPVNTDICFSPSPNIKIWYLLITIPSRLYQLTFNKLQMVSLVYILGIAMTGASDISTDLVSSNQITDYSFVTHDVALDPFNVILRCASGLGPSGSYTNTALGGWYFNGIQIPVPNRTLCDDVVFEVRGARGRNYPGVINLYLCGTFTTTEEGIYSCIMMNSSITNQIMRVGVYFSGRSKLLNMYPIALVLTIFHLSAQLLQ